MDNLDRAIAQLRAGCLLYVVNLRTGELTVRTQEEHLRAPRRPNAMWAAYIDPHVANLRSEAICASLRRHN